MDSAKGTRTGSRARRKIFSCPVCDEVFVDEESLRRHELTHQNPEAGAPAEEPAAAAPAAEPAPAEDPSAVQEAPAAPAPRRTLSSVRRQAQAQQQAEAAAAPAAQVEAPAAFLPTDSSAEIPVDPDATLKVPSPTPGLAPLGWEAETRKSGGLGQAWSAVEDFSEWVVRGTQNTFSFLGSSVVSGITLALKGLVVLAVAALFVYAGTWFGRVYGPRLWGRPGDQPVIPPRRTLSGTQQSTQIVRQLMGDFYSAIGRGDYQAAYDCLSPDWQAALTFDRFRDGYQETKSPVCKVTKVSWQSSSRCELSIRLQVTEKGQTHQYTGAYVAVLTPDGWKLDEGSLR